MIVQTTQVAFTRGYLEISLGGQYGDGVDVHIVVGEHVVNFKLTDDEAREVASQLIETADKAAALMAAKDAAYDKAEREALEAGEDPEQAALIAGEASEKVTL